MNECFIMSTVISQTYTKKAFWKSRPEKKKGVKKFVEQKHVPEKVHFTSDAV